MTPATRQKIADLRAQGLFQGWSDERVAQMLTRTAPPDQEDDPF